MSLLIATNLYKSFGSVSIIAESTFSVDKGQKIALVGQNGAGKSTLLRIIAGLEELDGGKIEIFKGIKVGYLPQNIIVDEKQTVLDYLEEIVGLSVPQHKIDLMLEGFGLLTACLDKKISTLSGGQKSKVALIGILSKEVDLLLLDEPTNNLDLPALIWLEDFLQKSDMACIIVSHDRRFLDRVVKEILEIDWVTKKILHSRSIYSDYLQNKLVQLESQKAVYQNQQAEIARLQSVVGEKKQKAAKGAKWQGGDNDKFLKGFKRERSSGSAKAAKAIEKRIEQMEEIEKPIDKAALEINLSASKSLRRADIEFKGVKVGYPSGFQVGPIDLDIREGERVGIIGLNGSGKSTLLKTMVGIIKPFSGGVFVGSGVRFGNLLQEQSSLPLGNTAIEFMMIKSGLSETEVHNQLSKFGFDNKKVKKQISTLSPGEITRLLLASFAALSVNILVLDEPTNHLDIEALNALEGVLENYQGTVVLVSHDRYFLEKAKLYRMYLLDEQGFRGLDDYQKYTELAEQKARKLLRLV